MQREQGEIPLQLRAALAREFLGASAADVGGVVDWRVEMYVVCISVVWLLLFGFWGEEEEEEKGKIANAWFVVWL